MNQLVYKEECYAIQGAVFEVYREVGCGFLEAVYQECLERELRERGIPFVAHPSLQLSYKGVPLKQTYQPDLVCYDSIILELKAVKSLTSEHEAQIFNYQKAASMKLGLLVNFGSFPKATVQRFVL
ncbi:GxxExxY protein [Gimesia panareensis]|uniref:GxxExxY protein n=1 Tax=Gimesia panareensis TaxID=2527978 RepID=UPI0011A0DC46|nr:GxxExxY protein [Gimesia panareensis]